MLKISHNMIIFSQINSFNRLVPETFSQGPEHPVHDKNKWEAALASRELPIFLAPYARHFGGMFFPQ